MMSANEGHILPHTDSSHKLVTIVIPILKENEWDKIGEKYFNFRTYRRK